MGHKFESRLKNKRFTLLIAASKILRLKIYFLIIGIHVSLSSINILLIPRPCGSRFTQYYVDLGSYPVLGIGQNVATYNHGLIMPKSIIPQIQLLSHNLPL